jgi:hypothetical protein
MQRYRAAFGGVPPHRLAPPAFRLKRIGKASIAEPPKYWRGDPPLPHPKGMGAKNRCVTVGAPQAATLDGSGDGAAAIEKR